MLEVAKIISASWKDPSADNLAKQWAKVLSILAANAASAYAAKSGRPLLSLEANAAMGAGTRIVVGSQVKEMLQSAFNDPTIRLVSDPIFRSQSEPPPN